jgi:hypothetical protein
MGCWSQRRSRRTIPEWDSRRCACWGDDDRWSYQYIRRIELQHCGMPVQILDESQFT